MCFRASILSVLLGSFLLSPALSGQGTPPAIPSEGKSMPPDDAAALKAFAAEPAVVLSRSQVLHYQADGTGTREYQIAFHIQSEAVARQLSVISISFASSTEKAEYLYARVRHADGTGTETPVSGALEQPEQVTREAPFYSDLKSLQLPIRSLGIGDTLEWKARFTVTKPEIPGHFWGQDTMLRDGVALHEVVELHVPATTQVTLYTNPEVAPPSETRNGSERVVRWTSSHLEPSVGPAAEAAKKVILTPEQQIALRKGALPSVAWTTFPSWSSVGLWYQQLQSDRSKSAPEIEAKVAQLTTGKATDQEKAFALYQYVATQVRYVGVAFGIGRYQPHTAAEVLANQYGDCKDKHTLLAAMLQSIGLHPEAVLVGAGVRFNEALPSPAAFNHLVTKVMLDGKQVWLDTTAEVAPWNTLMPQIRDQEALVVPQAGAPRVERTPMLPPFVPFGTLVAKETLDTSLTSDAHITLVFHDDDEIALRAVLRQISPAQYGEFLQRFVASLGFGGTATEPEISSPNDLATPLSISYRYKRIKEEDWGENRITEPFWPGSLPGIDEKNPPTAPIELGVPRTETSSVTIRLPSGWSAEVPEAIHAKAPYAVADTTFTLKGEELVAERKLTVLAPRVPAKDWSQYKKWLTDAGVGSYPYLQLIPKKGAKAGAERATLPAPSNGTSASTEGLVKQAMSALQGQHVEEARALLDKAKALDPKTRGLWGGYAVVSSQMGEMHRATEEVSREIAEHPDEVAVYGFLAELQQGQGKGEAALVSLRKWQEGAPDDPKPVIALMRLYARQGRVPEGVAVGSSSLKTLEKTNADLAAFRLELAGLEQRVGRQSDAAEVVRPLQGVVQDPGERNGVAYILADAKVDLSQDEATEKEVLAQLDAGSAAWTLDENQALLQRKTSLLIACWDTMGWIYLQQGRIAEAASYVRAAWRNAANAEITSHLEAVNTALHQNVGQDKRSDQQRRTFTLSKANGRHGTRELKLLLGEGKVLRAEAMGASSSTGLSESEALDLVKQADLGDLFPAGSGARLVRQGVVNCAGANCNLVLYPLGGL